MSLGFYEQRMRMRRRRRLVGKFVTWTIVLGAIFAAGAYAYETGWALARQDVAERDTRIEELTGAVSLVRAERDSLAVEKTALEEEIAALKQRYRAEVPSGDMVKLVALVRGRLADGVRPERLAEVIEQASNKRDCADDPQTKRFIVRTDLHTSGNDAVAFADGRVVVSAMGETATDAAGKMYAHFDPGKPVTLYFAPLGKERETVSGMLPLQYSLVTGETEHRFTATAGAQGFIEITGNRCRYP